MNILVTGVSRGLGFEIIKKLLNENYVVFGVSRTISTELNELKSKFNTNLYLLNFDLVDTENIQKTIFKEFIKSTNKLHGYINNAAIAYDDLVTNLNYDQLINMYKVNVFAPMIITKYVIRHMLLHDVKGSIVNISSISVHTGYKGLAMYASTKGAIEAFSKNVAREWGTKGIRSNCIIAGFMDTEMSSKLSEEQKSRIYERTSLKKPTDPRVVANLTEFLISDRSYSITGQNIFVDSGTI